MGETVFDYSPVTLVSLLLWPIAPISWCSQEEMIPYPLKWYLYLWLRLVHACSVTQDFLGKNTGVGCHFLLQGIFLTQGSSPSLLKLLHWQVDSLPPGPPGKPMAQATPSPAQSSVLKIFPAPLFHPLKYKIWPERRNKPVTTCISSLTKYKWLFISTTMPNAVKQWCFFFSSQLDT